MIAYRNVNCMKVQHTISICKSDYVPHCQRYWLDISGIWIQQLSNATCPLSSIAELSLSLSLSLSLCPF